MKFFGVSLFIHVEELYREINPNPEDKQHKIIGK